MRSALLCLVLCAACAAQVSQSPSLAGQQAAMLYARGQELAQLGDFTRAEHYLLAARRAGYDETTLVRTLVAASIQGGRLRSAVRHAQAYLARHPHDEALRRLLASVYWALGEPALAWRELSQLLVRAPRDAEAHYLEALVLSHWPSCRFQMHAAYRRYIELAPAGAHAEEARAALIDARLP
jgi:predicted Zn-dependent protease